MKIISIIGTRPEIIKMSPLLEKLKIYFEHSVIHSGQHYDPVLDADLFRELKLPQPQIRLKSGSGNFVDQMSLIMKGLHQALSKEMPDFVIVQGDTNTALCGALVAARLKIKIIHIEAGCRSNNLEAPEEQNRLLIDSIAHIKFCPDKSSWANLNAEGKAKNSFISGSTTFDAIKRSIKLAPKDFYLSLGVEKNKYIVATLHRAENMEDMQSFMKKIDYLNWLSEYLPIVFPIHPRTQKFFKMHKIKLAKGIIQCGPLSHLVFLNLLQNCRFAVSDSGGIQEEAAFLNRPCLILRKETEWLRLVKVKKNFLFPDLTSKDYGLTSKLIYDEKFWLNTCKIPNPESKFGSANLVIKILKTFKRPSKKAVK
jgi:UDP-N-acetylglucosamine 2-epimerase